MAFEQFVGVDGCKAGWFVVAIGPAKETGIGIFETFEKLWRTYSEARWILIDIPIGLPSQEIRSRPCDKKARKLLSPKRHHSIFSPPCREALAAGSYLEACRINQKVCDRKISIQAWHISKKIKEVDDLMTAHPSAQDSIRETHPEICFWALAGQKPLVHYKKSPQGQAERLALLKRYWDQATEIVKTALDRYPRRHLARDDIHDALVNAITASLLDDPIKTLPAEPGRDRLGLPMQMVYASPEL
jgi:predicted RNase H-like nuclease